MSRFAQARPAGHEHISPPQCCAQCRIEVVAAAVFQVSPELCDDDVYSAIAAVALTGAMLGHLARALARCPGALALGAPPSVGLLVGELRVRGSLLPAPALRALWTARRQAQLITGGRSMSDVQASPDSV